MNAEPALEANAQLVEAGKPRMGRSTKGGLEAARFATISARETGNAEMGVWRKPASMMEATGYIPPAETG